ncbi:formylglycine-generating enzyme family protein [Bosea sp. PAMC 26642]|uniref:formylglycine-generating enzyme family protein n=1 Tax=Bosea sp. (strain PAMC 26642) TaxID=1792307 RepID=UPI0007706691|nr:formylglycine-generating enzyme family protein [Bosea sp. PAMC 26642]AMJ59940.1 hypothetical protein AXW83_06205 [Bosea sp. PAMC 26642]
MLSYSKAGLASVASLLLLTMSVEAEGSQGSDRISIGNFAIDRFEVSIGQFRAFAAGRALQTAAEREGGGYEFAAGWTRRKGWTYAAPSGQPGSDHEPAVHISWTEARAYCEHAGGRLPTFAEWRLAAYTETRTSPTDDFITGRTYAYPVGDSPAGMNNSRQRHVAIGTTKRGVNGLHEMGANVWEWLADRRGDEALTAGGSWWYGAENTRAEGAQWKSASFFALYVGFRCAYDV